MDIKYKRPFKNCIFQYLSDIHELNEPETSTSETNNPEFDISETNIIKRKIVRRQEAFITI